MQKCEDMIEINADWCKGCGICVAFCPKSVLSLQTNKVKIENQEKCTSCGMCERLCPDYAINVSRNRSNSI